MSSFPRRVLSAVLIPAVIAPAVLLGLAACAGVVPLTPAADATNPACADVIVRLPDAIGTSAKRETNAQATGAWGEPVSVLLRCGVAVPGPSTLLCVTLKGIDWLRDDSDAPNYVFTTYGRDPAVEVVINGTMISGTDTLIDLSNAVGSIPATRACTNPDDVLGIPDPTQTPTPTPTHSSTP